VSKWYLSTPRATGLIVLNEASVVVDGARYFMKFLRGLRVNAMLAKLKRSYGADEVLFVPLKETE
jgi:hypothetical protein